MATEKNSGNVSDFEVDSHDRYYQSKVSSLRMVEGVRVGLTALALLMGLTILGVSGNSINAYNNTRVSSDFLSLALWPNDFNLQPTVALVVGSTIVLLTNIISLVFSKVRVLRNRTMVHTSLTFAAPLVGLVAALIAMVFFYAINASNTSDTLLSWTCRWKSIPMTQQPQWGTLCRESWAGVYLSILLIPVEAAVLGVAGYQLKAERHIAAYGQARKGSPVLEN
ncbi:hypothetical protein GQ53DRAFT_747140 [Thozetella sp. PMI_491]|nr:hypothetical protein GQ53DRAFT_747140 [Thozetella sp. PMI_491]